VFPGPGTVIGGILGAGAGAIAGGYLGQKAQGAPTPEQAVQAQLDQEQHPIASGMGGMLAQAPVMLATPEVGLGEGLAGRLAQNAAAGSIFSGTGVGAGIANGTAQPGDIMPELAKGAATMAPLGAWAPAAGIAALIGKPLESAATLAITNAAYDTMVNGKPFDTSKLAGTALENVPGFLALHIITSLMHGHGAPTLDTKGEGAKVGNEQPDANNKAVNEGISKGDGGMVPGGPGVATGASGELPRTEEHGTGGGTGNAGEVGKDAIPGGTAPEVSPVEPPPQTVNPGPSSEGAPYVGATSMRNAVVDQERVARGLPPLMAPAAREWGTAWDEAGKLLDANPNAGHALVDELNNSPRSLSDTENALLIQHKLNVQEGARNAASVINDPNADEAAKGSARLALARHNVAHAEVDSAGKVAGTHMGRGLNARKMMAGDDDFYSLPAILSREQAIHNDGAPLSDKQVAEVTARHAEFAKAKAAAEQATANEQTKQSGDAHNEALNQVNQEISQEKTAEKRKTPEQRRAPVKSELEQQAKAALARIQKRNAPAPKPIEQPAPNAPIEPKAEAPAKPRRAPRKGTFKPGTSSAFAADPVISAIRDTIGGIKSESTAKADGSIAGNGDLWDDKPALTHPTHNQIYSPTGQMPDKAAQALHMQGIGDGTVGGMWEAIGKASKSASDKTGENTGAADEEKDTIRKDKNFTEANKPALGRKAIDPNELAKGDSLNIEGEHVKVVHITYDDNGNADLVTLEDGSKFGRQRVEGDSVIYAESLTKGAAHDFLPADEPAKAPGGDLLSGKTDEPFNLFSESNKERQAREARELAEQNDAKAKQSAIDKAESDKKQGNLFDAPPVSKDVLPFLEQAAKDAEARQKARRQSGQMFFLPIHDMADSAIIGAYHISRGITDFAAWSKKMVETFGNGIRDHLPGIFKASKQHFEDTKARLEKGKGPEDVVAAHKPGDEPMGKFVKDVYKAHIKDNLDKPLPRPELEKRVNADVRRAYPEATDREIRDAHSDYHHVMFPSKDEIKTQIAQTKGVQKLVSRLEDINNGIPPKRFGLQRRPPAEEAKDLTKQIKAAMLKMGMKTEGAKLIKDDLTKFKDRTAAMTKKLQKRLDTGDFSKRQPRAIQYDAAAEKAVAGLEAVKMKLRVRDMQKALSERSMMRKAGDTLVKWQRFNLLSGIGTIAKLTTAAMYRMASTPLEEMATSGIRKLMPGVAAKAERQTGFSLKAEAKANTIGFMRGIRGAWQFIKTGKSDLDLRYGKTHARDLDTSFFDVAGNLHGALKGPVKETEFVRGYEHRMQSLMDQGLDGTLPAVQLRAATGAYTDANRSIFGQKSSVVDALNGFFAGLENSKTNPDLSYLAAKIGRTILPIVKVGTNYVAESMNYVGGVPRGTVELMMAMRRGLHNLKPEESDAILRHFAKGSVGAGMMLLGFMAPAAVGGYYQPGEKRRPGDVAAGTYKMFGVQIPHLLAHAPIIEAMQFGASVRRAMDYMNTAGRVHHKMPTGGDVSSATMAAAMGLLKEAPLIRGAEQGPKLFTPNDEGAKARRQYIKSFVVPQGLTDVAKWMDSAPGRKTATIGQEIQSGIPGMRESLPVKFPK
jgi:hypothetical protein